MKNTLILFSLFFAIFIISCSDYNPTQEEHTEAAGVVISDEEGNIVLRVFNGFIDTNFNTSLYYERLQLDSNTQIHTYSMHFLDEDGEELEFHADHEDEDSAINFLIADTTIVGMSLIEHEEEEEEDHKIEFAVDVRNGGTTDFEIQILHNGHIDFRTPKITVKVD